MAVKCKILSENEEWMKETVRNYADEDVSPKAKIVLASIIVEIEKASGEIKNG